MDDSTLTKRICTLLGSLDGWVWSEAGGSYPSGSVGVFYGRVGTTPDQACGVRVYDADDELTTGLKVRRVQLRFRGARNAPDGADKLADKAFGALQGLSRWEGINGVRRLSIAPTGTDGNVREERTDNYIVTVDNPEAQP